MGARLVSFWEDKRILITGGAGFLGSHIVENLTQKRGVSKNQIRITRSKTLDLRLRENCEKAVADIDVVIHLAARVGGIGFNQKNPATLFYDNIIMGTQLIEASRLAGIKKFVQVGTVCSYPKFTPTPFKEENIWDGYPEETNAPYGIAKKALLVMAQAYRQQYGMNIIYLIPVNLYGPDDNFNPESSHVIPALIRKFTEAVERGDEQVIVWGTGKASREFLYAKDAAEGILLAAEKYNNSNPVNLGTGKEITIKDLANQIAYLTGFKGQIIWDITKPDGQPKRCLDVSTAKQQFGFEAATDLKVGLKETIAWYKKSIVKKS